MKSWARSQVFFLSHKFRLHRQLGEKKAPRCRSTSYEDAEIFAKNLFVSATSTSATFTPTGSCIGRSMKRSPARFDDLPEVPGSHAQATFACGRAMEHGIPTVPVAAGESL